MAMDDTTKAEIESIKKAVERLEGMIQRLLDKEESRISRISEIEIGIEKLRGECNTCRGKVDARLDDGNKRFRDHEDRVSALEDPEHGAVLRGEGSRARDQALGWIELAKGIFWIAGVIGFVAVSFFVLSGGKIRPVGAPKVPASYSITNGGAK